MTLDPSNSLFGRHRSQVISIADKARPVMRLLVHYNPFYLLSACCMLLGVLVLNGGLDWSPLPRHSLLALIVTLNCYEIALVAIGILLLRRGVVRDGLFVLILAVFFLVDAGFLNMEMFTADPVSGLAVNLVLLVLAILKLGAIIILGLRIRPGMAMVSLIGAQLAILYGTPGFLSHMAFDAAQRRGELTPWAVFVGWCAFGFMPVLGALLRSALRERWTMMTGAQRIGGSWLTILPAVSMLAHLCLAHWVYEVSFELVNIAPLLLGLAVLMGHWEVAIETRFRRAVAQGALALLGVACSVRFPDAMLVDMGAGVMSPLRLVLLTTALVWLDAWWNLRYAWFAVGAAMCLSAGAAGASIAMIASRVAIAARAALEAFRRIVPQTTSQWGITSVGAAFVLLAIGAVISWLGKALRLQPAGIEPLSRSSEDDAIRHIRIDRD